MPTIPKRKMSMMLVGAARSRFWPSYDAVTLPEGITQAQFGRLAGFVQGQAASSQASTEATVEIISNLKTAGISSDSIVAFQKFYEGVASANPSNLAAVHRAALLASIAKVFQ